MVSMYLVLQIFKSKIGLIILKNNVGLVNRPSISNILIKYSTDLY